MFDTYPSNPEPPLPCEPVKALARLDTPRLPYAKAVLRVALVRPVTAVGRFFVGGLQFYGDLMLAPLDSDRVFMLSFMTVMGVTMFAASFFGAAPILIGSVGGSLLGAPAFVVGRGIFNGLKRAGQWFVRQVVSEAEALSKDGEKE